MNSLQLTSSSNSIQTLTAFLLSLCFLAFIGNSILKRKLSENFAFFFIILGLFSLLASFRLEESQRLLAQLMGVEYAPLAFLFVGLALLLFLALQYAAHLTQLHRSHRKLVQALAVESGIRFESGHLSADRELMFLIPAYNEGRNISRIISELRAKYPQFSVAVVDDGSADDTSAQAREAGAVVLRHPCNLGYGCALQTGYKFALAVGMNAVLQLDGDGQHPIENVDRMLSRRASVGADLVIGNRFSDKESYQVPLARRIGIGLFRSILKLRKVSIDDPTSGLQLIGARLLPLLTTDEFPVDFPDADLLLFLSKKNFVIAETAAVMRKNETGRSMHSGLFKPMFYLYKMLLSILMVELRLVSQRGSRAQKA
jgi:hypothetical protein